MCKYLQHDTARLVQRIFLEMETGLDSDNRGSEKRENPFERATLDVGWQIFSPAVLDVIQQCGRLANSP